MIRELLIAVFFFFAPALVMLMLRNAALLLLLWLKHRERRAREPEVIDVTPVPKDRASRWFYVAVVIISLISAVTVFLTLQRNADVENRQYVPAYTDESGNIVKGHWKSTQER